MQLFHIRYRNAQGALMRILNAVSRRGLDLTSVHAKYDGQHHSVSMLLDTNHKLSGQLFREWYSIVDVINVHSSPGLRQNEVPAWPAPPASDRAVQQPARAALA